MQGPSEFTITGTLRRYNITPFLKKITVPTIDTVGECDEANPEIIRGFARTTAGAKVAVLRGAAHLTPWDARDENVRVVREFLRAADPAADDQPRR
jgi:proline iminopeptidase